MAIPESYKELEAEFVPIEIGRFKLNTLKHENTIYIPTNEGLKTIGVNINWIASQRKFGRRCPLFRRGFSFQEKLLCYPMGDDGRFFFAGSYTWSDWLIVWEYFAAQGNSKAASILKSLAEYGLTLFLSNTTQKT
jgi:hypothetical protein